MARSNQAQNQLFHSSLDVSQIHLFLLNRKKIKSFRDLLNEACHGCQKIQLNPQNSNYLVTEIGYTNGKVLTNLWLLPGKTLDNTKTDIKIKYVKGVKIKLK